MTNKPCLASETPETFISSISSALIELQFIDCLASHSLHRDDLFLWLVYELQSRSLTIFGIVYEICVLVSHDLFHTVSLSVWAERRELKLQACKIMFGGKRVCVCVCVHITLESVLFCTSAGTRMSNSVHIIQCYCAFAAQILWWTVFLFFNRLLISLTTSQNISVCVYLYSIQRFWVIKTLYFSVLGAYVTCTYHTNNSKLCVITCN